MTELEEFERFCRDAGHYPVVEAIQRWRNMSTDGKIALRERWNEEDKQEQEDDQGDNP